MQNRTGHSIKLKAQLAKDLLRHHFPKKTISLKPLSGGLTNFVFAANLGSEKLVVRINDKADRIHFFQKEQWAVIKAKEKGVPVPEILEVGNDIIPFPYMISRQIEGKEATHHPLRREIIREMGRYASLIHTVRTTGFGHSFDWSPNTLSKNDTWKSYLKCELKANERLTILKTNQMLPFGMAKKISAIINQVGHWKQNPCLHHGDLRLKNVLVNKMGKIVAIIDWENALSSIGPAWDMSIALHDLSIDAQWQYLEGYGIPNENLLDMAPAIKVFNLLNYAPVVKKLIDKKQKQELDHYKMRLNGILDLFSL